MFSSSRRTRYAMPGISSPTGAYSRRRSPRPRTACLMGAPMPWSIWISKASSGQAQLSRRGDGRRQRAHVVARERRSDVFGVLEHHARQLLVHGVAVGLVGEHRDGPSVLRRDDRLVVPVGALDEAQVDRRGRARGPLDELRRSLSASRR